MKSRVNKFKSTVAAAIIIGIVAGVFAAVTLSILAGGWLLNRMFPTIPYEFASIIAGQGLLIGGLLLVFAGYTASKALKNPEFHDLNSDDDGTDGDSDKETDSDEAAEWLAERIADITHAKLTQNAPRSRRYTAKPRGK